MEAPPAVLFPEWMAIGKHANVVNDSNDASPAATDWIDENQELRETNATDEILQPHLTDSKHVSLDP